MKKLCFLLLLLIGMACSGNGESPIIKINKLSIDAREDGTNETVHASSGENFVTSPEQLPALKVGDELTVVLSLDGNGADLKAFQVKADHELDTKIYYHQEEVTREENLTDETEGYLRFSDGVLQTQLMIKVLVKRISEDGNAALNFYLSSKAECEGAQEALGVKTEKEIGEDNTK